MSRTGLQANVPALLEALGIEARLHRGELWAPCPSPKHNETRPSWSIKDAEGTPGHGRFYCFGCHFTGGAVDLVMAVRRLSYGGARWWMEERNLWLKAGLPTAVRFETTKRFSRGLRIPEGLIDGPLPRWVSPARRYAESRGVTDEQRARWDLCYAVDGAMAGRILFPLKDSTGRWLGWHGRTFVNDVRRYKNAGEDDGFDPSAIFGVQHWPEPEHRAGRAMVLTEGSIDALACERAGAEFVAAIGSSQPHARQLLRLRGWPVVIVASDGDEAGEQLFQLLRANLSSPTCRVLRLPMPEGKDAQMLGQKALSRRIEQCLASVSTTAA